MRGSTLKKTVKTLIGLLMLPLCAAAWSALAEELSRIPLLTSRFFWIYVSGICLFTASFVFLGKPIRVYIWGHELTHALFIVLSRGKIHKIKIGQKSGYVKSDTINFLVSLAPYYFPLYTVLVFLVFRVASWIWPSLPGLYPAYIFLLGFTLAFHLVFTGHIIYQGQEDLRYNGLVFSLITILLTNMLVFGALTAGMSRGSGTTLFLNKFVSHSIRNYSNIVALCNRLASGPKKP